jgi:basic membrane protein A and related proteins
MGVHCDVPHFHKLQLSQAIVSAINDIRCNPTTLIRGKMKKHFWLIIVIALLIVPGVSAQDDGIQTVCLITGPAGRINDGTFNQYAYQGMMLAADDYDLDMTFIETVNQTEVQANISSCIDEGYEVVITVGFQLADDTYAMADANPDTLFIGVGQFFMEMPENYVGLQFREDQAGFLAGALAALVAEELDADTVAGIYGLEIPPVIKFRNGYEQGALYINPDINVLGAYHNSFNDAAAGASAAQQFIGESAVVIFGSGGQTGSGGILAAAQEGVFVIGVDQDEYYTTFGGGETPGAEYLISSAVKRVDLAVYQMVEILALGELESFPGGTTFVFDAAIDGIGLAERHDADISDELFEQMEVIFDLLAAGELATGVNPFTGALIVDGEMSPEATAEADE